MSIKAGYKGIVIHSRGNVITYSKCVMNGVHHKKLRAMIKFGSLQYD